MTQAQLAWYRAMEERGEIVQVRDAPRLDGSSRWQWRGAANAPIGYILSLEGADSLVTLSASRTRLRLWAPRRRAGH